jgi:hypothetical protein
MRALQGRAAALAALALLGCAHSMISDGEIRSEALGELSMRTAAAAGAGVPGDLAAESIRREDTRALLREIALEDWTPEALAAYRDGLVTVGLWPDDRDLLDEFTSVGGEEVAGLYVPARRTLYVVEDPEIPLLLRVVSAIARRDLFREIVLAHELVHAIQHDTHPRLLEESLAWREQDDAAAAVSAAVEGDATRVGFEVVMPGRLPSEQSVRDELASDVASRSKGPLAEAPALVRLTVAFPYEYGYGLSLAEGSALLDAPPASTEQVLHPEHRRAPFLAIDLKALREALPSGCRFVAENTVGELGLSVLFRDLSSAPDPSAWRGWDGDRYLVARCGERRELLWLTVWDGPVDAGEFEAGYRGIVAAVAARAGFDDPPRMRRAGKEVLVFTSGLAPLAERAPSLARRKLVATLDQLQNWLDEPARDRP